MCFSMFSAPKVFFLKAGQKIIKTYGFKSYFMLKLTLFKNT